MKKELLIASIVAISALSTASAAETTATVNPNTLLAATGSINGPVVPQATTLDELIKQQSELNDRQQIKELVDRFSVLADEKNGLAQEDLFTADAQVDNYMNGVHRGTINGKQAIAKVYDDYLHTQDVVYHVNGQQVVRLNGDNTADGIAYCYVVLISTKDGKQVKRTQGVRYVDNYQKVDGKWLINKRQAFFEWAGDEDYNNALAQPVQPAQYTK